MRLGVGEALVDGEMIPGDVELLDGRVAGVGLAPAGPGSAVAIPGLVDLQVNGTGAVDFVAADPAGWDRAGTDLARSGTTSFQPTFITDEPDRVLAALGGVPDRAGPAAVIGVHLEGPFIAPDRLGAHPARFRRQPDQSLLARLLAAGPVQHITLAPELDGALDLVRAAWARGVTVACGHSNATAAEAHEAFDQGANVVTHLFNAMSLGDHRAPGLAMAALARPDVFVTVIGDGVHVSDDALLLAWRAAAGRLALVSDAVADRGAAGPLERHGTVYRRPDGTLAGSAVPLLAGVRRLAALGVPFADAVKAGTSVPASIARTGSARPGTAQPGSARPGSARSGCGRLAPGVPADVVVLDDRLDIREVFVAGRAVA